MLFLPTVMARSEAEKGWERKGFKWGQMGLSSTENQGTIFMIFLFSYSFFLTDFGSLTRVKPILLAFSDPI